MEGQLVSPEAQVGDGFGSSLSASSDCSPGILAIGGPLFLRAHRANLRSV
jgi:hypothetical protein